MVLDEDRPKNHKDCCAERFPLDSATAISLINRLKFPLPDDMTDAALEGRLFPEAGTGDFVETADGPYNGSSPERRVS